METFTITLPNWGMDREVVVHLPIEKADTHCPLLKDLLCWGISDAAEIMQQQSIASCIVWDKFWAELRMKAIAQKGVDLHLNFEKELLGEVKPKGKPRGRPKTKINSERK